MQRTGEDLKSEDVDAITLHPNRGSQRLLTKK